ncbi:hypothetical protein N7509_009229 [Penicillium cosmopolitanum]|uniref:Uncharacterized protein n=1 Tax=Penicillium cosmopolitanum TaxID=1131564 RepID=A0A9X0B3E3_9EURO|nr:uncharacterized protein N7509_009229 [Penicillium cosmopolitanum]KAJ5386688.1 hypothetical protein N7509_009229 [Penicillium cosmopolitanum]
MAPRLACSSPRALSRSICANRWIATKSFGDAPFAHTWLTKTPETITTDDILSSLSFSPAKDTTPLLLVTPKFAHWLDPTDEFLPKLLGRLYTGSDPIYAVAAIVDKLPNISAFPMAPSQTSAAFEGAEPEGLSLLVVPQLNVQGKAAPPHAADLSTHQIGLRLAHTIFVNGKESTLLGMRWTWDKTAGDNGAFALNDSVDLTNCIVKTSSSVADIQSTLTLPLHPVGQRRKVISSMGNILRQVSKSTDPDSVAPMPASTELEKELPRYISENNIVDQRVSVWALIEKPTATVSCSQHGLLESVSHGGKLHRVISGGGGWGKKQGLLSLDPEIAFPGTAGKVELDHLDDLFSHNTSKVSDLPPPFLDGLVGDDLSILSQVATEGDFIQFYVSTESTPSPQDESRQNNAPSDAISYCFGIVSDAEQLDTHPNENKALASLPNTFGALSEKGITYSRSMPMDEEQQETTEWGSGLHTKLDIPGCQVILSPAVDSE